MLESLGVGSLMVQGWCRSWRLCYHIPRMALPVYLFGHFCCRMYHLVTVHIILSVQYDSTKTEWRLFSAMYFAQQLVAGVKICRYFTITFSFLIFLFNHWPANLYRLTRGWAWFPPKKINLWIAGAGLVLGQKPNKQCQNLAWRDMNWLKLDICNADHRQLDILVKWYVVVIVTGSQFSHATSYRSAGYRRLLQLCTKRRCLLGHCNYLSSQLRRCQLHQANCRHHGVTHCSAKSHHNCQCRRHVDGHIWCAVVQQGNTANIP